MDLELKYSIPLASNAMDIKYSFFQEFKFDDFVKTLRD